MPGFSLATGDARCFIGFISNQRRTHPVRYLTNEQQRACIGALEAEHGVQVDQQVSEPHRGAQVVEKMSRCVTKPPADWQRPTSRHKRLHDWLTPVIKLFLFTIRDLSLSYLQIHYANSYTNRRWAKTQFNLGLDISKKKKERKKERKKKGKKRKEKKIPPSIINHIINAMWWIMPSRAPTLVSWTGLAFSGIIKCPNKRLSAQCGTLDTPTTSRARARWCTPWHPGSICRSL